MALAVQQSLFEGQQSSTIVEPALWIEALVLGEIALGLSVLAVALVGALMLAGRLPLRQGMRVAMGCFVLLGAPMMAAALFQFRDAAAPIDQPVVSTLVEISPARPELPPAQYDPYAGASLREDQ
jgi:type IV secretory pathway VirB2 component (pilin)